MNEFESEHWVSARDALWNLRNAKGSEFVKKGHEYDRERQIVGAPLYKMLLLVQAGIMTRDLVQLFLTPGIVDTAIEVFIPLQTRAACEADQPLDRESALIDFFQSCTPREGRNAADRTLSRPLN